MTKNMPDAQLSLISESIARHFGLHFPRERWADLERGVRAAAEECDSHRDLESYIEALLSSALTPGNVDALASHLTIGETYFFRERRSLEVFAEEIMPELTRAHSSSGSPIRIWSAGCATGEEPYSVAMVLSKWMAALRGIEILGTDVNIRSLHRASKGIYADWSFRGTPPWVRNTFFKANDDGRWAIVPAIKQMVEFAPLNLMDDTYPPLSNGTNGMDVIFCRNVLMYFTPEALRKVIRRLYGYLATDGWLIVSPTETSHELFSDFATVSFGDVTLYRKSNKRLLVAPTLPVCNEQRSSVQQPARVDEARPFAASVRQANPNAQDADPGAVSTDLPAASFAQALRLYEQGRYEEAVRTTDALLSENGSDTQAMFLRARIDANQGKLDEALVWCDKAIATDKMAPRAHYLRAMILQEQGSIAGATLALKQAVYAEPHFVLGHFALGNLALKDGRRKESVKYFENVLLLLARYQPDDIVPESEGLSAGRLREMILRPCATVAAPTEQQPARTAQQMERFELSRR